MVEKEMEDRYAVEKNLIYEEIKAKKDEEKRKDVARKSIEFAVDFPGYLYVFLSATSITCLMALMSLIATPYLIEHRDYSTIYYSYILVAIMFFVWIIYGGYTIHVAMNRKKYIDKILKKKGLEIKGEKKE